MTKGIDFYSMLNRGKERKVLTSLFFFPVLISRRIGNQLNDFYLKKRRLGLRAGGERAGSEKRLPQHPAQPISVSDR